MTLIACLDNNDGMSFNNRRQSQDKNVIKKIIEISQKHRLVMSPYSAILFSDCTENIFADENFLENIKNDDFCFIEKHSPSHFTEITNKIIIFRWNRNYPYDKTFDIDLKSWTFESSEEFVGTSHNKITMEVWTK